LHAKTATTTTDPDVITPGLTQDIGNGQTTEPLREALMTLQAEDHIQKTLFGAVAKETVISDLLKSFGKDMHKESSDEFFVRESNI
jgi:hypothetical protein